MSLWEFSCCIEGWNQAQGGGHRYNGEPMTDEDYDALCALGERWNNGE